MHFDMSYDARYMLMGCGLWMHWLTGWRVVGSRLLQLQTRVADTLPMLCIHPSKAGYEEHKVSTFCIFTFSTSYLSRERERENTVITREVSFVGWVGRSNHSVFLLAWTSYSSELIHTFKLSC